MTMTWTTGSVTTNGDATFTIQGLSQAPSGGGHIISVWCKTNQGSNTELDAQLMLIHVGRFQ